MLRRTLERASILATLVLALGATSALASDDPTTGVSAATACAVDAQLPLGPVGQSCGPMVPSAASPCPPGTVPCATQPRPMALPAQQPMMGQSMGVPSPIQGASVPNGTGGAQLGYSPGPGLLLSTRMADPNPLWPAELCAPSWCYQWDIWSRPGLSPFAIGSYFLPFPSVALPTAPTWQPAQVCGCPWPQ